MSVSRQSSSANYYAKSQRTGRSSAVDMIVCCLAEGEGDERKSREERSRAALDGHEGLLFYSIDLYLSS